MAYVQQPLFVDDFGTAYYVCTQTKAVVPVDRVKKVGAVLPGLNSVHFIENSPEAISEDRRSRIVFQESERNCNTCSHLRRVLHQRSRDGFLFGTCSNPGASMDEHPYRSRERNGVMTFHPDDPMHMPCYVSRWATGE